MRAGRGFNYLAVAIVALVALCAFAISGCGSSDDSSAAAAPAVGSGGTKLDVVGYSTAESAYESLESAFVKTDQGKDVEFAGSFGPSIEQTEAVVDGQDASIVLPARESEMGELAKEDFVSDKWIEQPDNGIGQKTIVTMSVRKGNPKGIQAFKDLLTKDVEIVIPNPETSGEGRWDLMGIWSGFIIEELTPNLKPENFEAVMKKIVLQPDDAKEASAAFAEGTGDVLVGFESDAIQAEEEGSSVEMIIPPATLSVEIPIAGTEGAPEPAAEDFLEFVRSSAGQKLLMDAGYRPVDPKLNDPKRFPKPKVDVLDMGFYGGWVGVNEYFFDKGGIFADLEEKLDIPTSG